MHDALFLPRELFSPAPAAAAPVTPSAANRVSAQFRSGETVAADLLQGSRPIANGALLRERRRTPRGPGAIGVDLHLGDRD